MWNICKSNKTVSSYHHHHHRFAYFTLWNCRFVQTDVPDRQIICTAFLWRNIISTKRCCCLLITVSTKWFSWPHQFDDRWKKPANKWSFVSGVVFVFVAVVGMIIVQDANHYLCQTNFNSSRLCLPFPLQFHRNAMNKWN